ncbi:MAG: hypothetical protein E7638_05685 [Ruminococcaceae bacterium]|nr:hypothetical protein [Oscillospiraceae bacterium]
MKRILSIFLLLVVTLTAILLSGCSSDKTEEETLPEDFLVFQPMYIGEEVTDTDHKFKKDDFKVTAIYSDYTEEVTDYTFEVVHLKDGDYKLRFEWMGIEEILFVPVNVVIYPSETAGK